MSKKDTRTESLRTSTLNESIALEKSLYQTPMTDEEVMELASKIEALVRQECDVKEKSYGVRDALMLATHHLLGWRDFRKLFS